MTRTSLRTLLLSLLAMALAATIAGAALSAPAQRIPLPDESQVNINVCTGNLTTVTLSNRVLVIHDDVDPNFGQHQAGTITGDITTADGFSGRLTVHFGMNLKDISDPLVVGEFSNVASLTLQGEGGQLIRIHALFHVVVLEAGGVKGSVDYLSAECLGKPS